MGMTMTSHTDCPHPATKAARAKCRKVRAAHEAEVASLREAIIRSYYDNTADVEDIIAGLRAIDPDLTEGYYDGDLDIEDIIARAK